MSTAPESAPQGQAATTTAESPGLLDQIIKQSRLDRDHEQRAVARDLIGEFVDQVMAGQMTVGKNTQAMINARIAEIDRLLSEQLNEIMHHADFQRLEAAWRGLQYLVTKSELGTQLKIKVLNVAKKDLAKDLSPTTPFDQSQLFKKVYEDEFGTFGGQPFGALIGDYEFSRSPQDVELLSKIANVAAAAHAPFISAASAQMFGWDSFTELNDRESLAKIFEGPDYIRWRSFRDSEAARYVGLCLPHVLMRRPYGTGDDDLQVEAFGFQEDVDGTDHGKYLWGNAAYAFAARMTDSFARYNWCVAIRGVDGGGLVADLPVHGFNTGEGKKAEKCPTEVAIPDRREKEFSDLGFISLLHCKNTDYAAFFGAQSCQKERRWDTDEANANARLSTRLPYIMATSRIAHFLKVMCRDKIGSFKSRSECEAELNRWISQYVLEQDDASMEYKAERPLREARIVVADDPARPGCYKANAYLRPHYQLEELTVALHLVAELPESKGG